MEGLTLKYKGFEGDVMWDDNDKLFVGKVLELPSGHLAKYRGEDMNDIIENFIDAVDEYLEAVSEGYKGITIA